MSLIRDNALVVDDYLALDDETAPPAEGRLLLSWARWQELAPQLTGRHVGLRLANTVDVEAIATELVGLPLIALEFPAFPDGRAYSQARLLRTAIGYRGELRAIGNAVVRDQLAAMQRCGFNSFVLRADQDVASCLAVLQRGALVYQPAADTLAPVPARRRLPAAG